MVSVGEMDVLGRKPKEWLEHPYQYRLLQGSRTSRQEWGWGSGFYTWVSEADMVMKNKNGWNHNSKNRILVEKTSFFMGNNHEIVQKNSNDVIGGE